jgi:hypothetical protein
MGETDMHPCQRILTATQYLQMNGFSQDQLKRLHAEPGHHSDTTFNAVKSEYAEEHDLGQTNHAFANRLCYVAVNYAKRRGTFSDLVENAIAVWPGEARVFAYV